ncbi:VOC family protein [Kosakonia sacchari]|uniref:Catechol 2,3-dioxygenase n=1 Tax=Kosakonia sacchari TaxID=1158459 RepID=A0A1G4Y5M0_9ENTR|nr:VOC family protein [Kosakonia sacchari]AHJ75367.1 glyoxalase [Kosakonia sacchari SP1]NUL37673.1 VOC family protein [Kosakonia sacchari]SCX48774.1 Catechol 2,3-dioxygenase [Kosakonia sacchari]
MSIRGIDHIGITVPDIEGATRFLIDALGAELIYQSVAPEDKNIDSEAQQKTLRLVPGTTITSIRMLKLQHGPGIELFEMHGPEQREPLRASDFGLQHFAVYTEGIDAALQRFKAAGGMVFTTPQPLGFPTEKGAGNCFCYGRTPWGSIVEFITWPTPMPYEQETTLRRWKP